MSRGRAYQPRYPRSCGGPAARGPAMALMQREAANTFGTVAEAWMKFRARKITAPTIAKNRWLLDHYLLSPFGTRPIRNITSRDLLDALKD